MKATLPQQPLSTNTIDGERLYWSTRALTFSDHTGGAVVIKSNFLSDGLSIPKFFQSIFSKSPHYIYAGILHDYGYRADFPYAMSRKGVDKLFLHYMKEYGVGWLTRHTIYRAVRIGAARNWKARDATYYAESIES